MGYIREDDDEFYYSDHAPVASDYKAVWQVEDQLHIYQSMLYNYAIHAEKVLALGADMWKHIVAHPDKSVGELKSEWLTAHEQEQDVPNKIMRSFNRCALCFYYGMCYHCRLTSCNAKDSWYYKAHDIGAGEERMLHARKRILRLHLVLLK